MPRTSQFILAMFFLVPVRPLLAANVDYLKEVKPILASRCYACHGGLKQKGRLRLDTAALIKKGGETGPAIVPGKSNDSLLVAHITATKGARRMPPKTDAEPLKDQEIALIKSWIDQGGIAPLDEKPESDPREHWAFKAPIRPTPFNRSPSGSGWIKNPIDAFLAAEHQKLGLIPQPPADKRILLRRVYLDLIGLPPTREEQEAFIADNSADAYEKVVERLLASQHYGERWGRHWMDVWRYSDWWGLGAEVRNSQKHIWRWRDWIIQSLNDDKGYDQMVREMLAADELYPNDMDKLRATGFLVRSYFIFNRNTWMEETVEHTSKAFLGITLNCTRCHDHKYDPFPQEEYYRFRAFFEPYQVRMDQVPGESDYQKDGLPRIFDCNPDVATFLFIRGDEKNPKKDKALTPGVPTILSFADLNIQPVSLPPEAHTPGLRSFVLDNYLKEADKQVEAAKVGLDQARKNLAEVEKIAPKPLPKVEKPAPPSTPANPNLKPLVKDDFAAAKPDVWTMASGTWKYEKGKLIQEQEGDNRAALRLKPPAPADFQAKFSFAITGGKQWFSVGLAFDVVGEKEVLVYLSANSGGKLQIAYKEGAAYTFPVEGTQVRAVKLNEPQEMTIKVRGTLLNVAVNGKHALAYRLPIARRKGGMDLITYDAKAEFRGFEIAELPKDLVLLDTAAPAIQPMTLEQARAMLVLAEKTLAAAGSQTGSLKARTAADRAKIEKPLTANAPELARQAAKEEKQAVLAKADEDLARAEWEYLRAPEAKKTEADAKRKAAATAQAQAKKALENPGETYTSLRGSLKTPENNLETEASRAKPYPTTSTGRRTALAKWMTDQRHPLTARVGVNHMWARHFGKPLVPTVFDFGRKGAPPTNQALLDWLALEFMQGPTNRQRERPEGSWSMKHLHRLIVTSNAYQMTSSSANAAANNLAADPENRFYWRMNPTRMEAQIVRDSLFHLAGDLDLTMGGPSIPVNDEKSRRRSLYFVHSHNDHNKFLSMFDDAGVLECYRRAESIVPQQALTLSNSQLAMSMAEKIAARLDQQLGAAADSQFIRAAFETVLASSPTAGEQAECEQALKQIIEVLKEAKDPAPAKKARIDLIQALLNHNDFITIR